MSIEPRVRIRRGPKVLLCFIIGKTLYTVRRNKNFNSQRKFERRIIQGILLKSYPESMVSESVVAKIFKIGSVTFEFWPFYLITLLSAFVSITKMNMMKLNTLKLWNIVTALSHYSVPWTSVITFQVKCLVLRSRSKSKVKLTFGVIKWVTASSNDPVTFWGHKLGQTNHKGHRHL